MDELRLDLDNGAGGFLDLGSTPGGSCSHSNGGLMVKPSIARTAGGERVNESPDALLAEDGLFGGGWGG